ncbi:helix-turn-helix domain-containing protein [Nonomuraea endophytica]|uniref:Transcriptional regulator with XRE-family HTH domain n=1 Tax=Nonomuraea endophytica TaxID=714136 RepID=A0A7W8EET0_9ACTN|nr:transcriptional regulator with XRE-family HTH domain [Nonomuraea endophytica]
MLRSGVTRAALADAAGVDVKTVTRWMNGRVPHRANRLAIAATVNEDEATLWPMTRSDQTPGGVVTSEVVGAYAHRVDVPASLWESLLVGAHETIDIVGYCFLFIWEQHIDLPKLIAAKCAAGARVRIALADPDYEHVRERDELEQLGGTLPGRIRNALNHIRELREVPGVHIGLHQVHLYSAIYRFDCEMIVTPYLYRARGYQHPALHLRELSPHGVFTRYADQFEQIWGTTKRLESVTAG